MSVMSTQQISLPIVGRGRTSPQFLRDVERALSQLDGVVTAPVNFAAESAMVVYDPARITLAQIVGVIREAGCDTPLHRLTIRSGDLWYATSTQTVERVLRNHEGVVRVSANPAAQTVAVEVLPGFGHVQTLEHELQHLGFERAHVGADLERSLFVLRLVVLVAVELLALWSTGSHAGVLVSPGGVHAPFVVVILSLAALWGAGSPFLRAAYDALLIGELDSGVIVALLASGFALLSVPIGLLFPSSWLTGLGFVLATTLVTGWFAQRACSIWLWPRVREATLKSRLLAGSSAQVGVVSDGSRH